MKNFHPRLVVQYLMLRDAAPLRLVWLLRVCAQSKLALPCADDRCMGPHIVSTEQQCCDEQGLIVLVMKSTVQGARRFRLGIQEVQDD